MHIFSNAFSAVDHRACSHFAYRLCELISHVQQAREPPSQYRAPRRETSNVSTMYSKTVSMGSEGMTRNSTWSSRWNIGRTDTIRTCGLTGFSCISSHAPNQNGCEDSLRSKDVGSLSPWLAWEKRKTWQPEAGQVPLGLRSGNRAVTTGRRERQMWWLANVWGSIWLDSQKGKGIGLPTGAVWTIGPMVC